MREKGEERGGKGGRERISKANCARDTKQLQGL